MALLLQFCGKSRIRLKKASNALRVKALAAEASQLDALPLLIEVIRIERRLQRGTWQIGDDGRLWVFVD